MKQSLIGFDGGMNVMTFHMRRKEKEITDKAVLTKILKSARYMTVALCMDNEPYLVTLSHGYDEHRNCIYFHCAAEGKKIAYIKANNMVWGQAMLDYGYVEGKCNHRFASVEFSGRITFIEGNEEKLQAMKCMIRQLDSNPDALLAKLRPEKLNNTLMGRIDIDFMSGKKSEDVNVT